MAEKKLPLRIGVGVIVLNNENKIFVGKRKDNPVNKWQMPQGGVDKNESFLSAMKRELNELKAITLQSIATNRVKSQLGNKYNQGELKKIN